MLLINIIFVFDYHKNEIFHSLFVAVRFAYFSKKYMLCVSISLLALFDRVIIIVIVALIVSINVH